MDLLIPIFVSLVQLALLGGLVYLFVRLVSRRDRGPTESGAVSIRRFFLYSLMLGTLILSGLGIAGVVSAAASASLLVTKDSTAIAMSLAFVLVGVPVYGGLAFFAAGRLREDPMEQRSLGWAFYLTVALVGSLVTTMSVGGGFLTALVVDARFDRTLFVHLVVWGSVWIGHWLVVSRREPKLGASAHLLLGSAAGLIVTAGGVAGLLVAALRQIYDVFWTTTIVGGGVEDIVGSVIVVIIGIPVWWWYWFRHARGIDRTPMWTAYVLLLGVLGGVVATVSGAGVMVYGVLEWFIGDPAVSSAGSHFMFLPASLGIVATGGAVWAYHAAVLGSRDRRERTEVDRIYDYLLAGVGLTVGAAGIVTIVAVALGSIAGGDVTSSAGNAVAAAITLLAVGLPLWWKYWSLIIDRRDVDPSGELSSITRRIYIFGLFGAAGVVAVISLIVVLFVVIEDLLDGTSGRGTLGSVAVPVGLLVTAGTLAWYHFAVFREDRADAPEQDRSMLREIIVVATSEDPLESLIGDRTHAPIRVLRSSSPPVVVGTLDEVLEELAGGTFERVVIVARGDGRYDLVRLED